MINARDNENNTQKRKAKKAKTERCKGVARVESVRAKWFCCAFKLGFAQLICEAFLNF